MKAIYLKKTQKSSTGPIGLRLFLLALCMGAAVFSKAQSSAIQGTIVDELTHSAVPDATIKLLRNGAKVLLTVPDSNGHFELSPVEPGTYDLFIHTFSMGDLTIKDIEVSSSIKYLGEVLMKVSDSAVVKVYGKNNFDPNKPGEGFDMDHKKLKNMPGTITTAILLGGGTTSTNGRDIIFRGNATGNGYVIDDVNRGFALPNMSKLGIDNVEVLQGGVSAENGDFTGSLVKMTQRAPSSKWDHEFEIQTSQGIDPFGYNAIQGFISGPLIKIKGDDSKVPLGISISGGYTHQDVYNPPALDLYRVKDDVLAQLRANPVMNSPLGNGYITSASMVTMNDMQKTRIEANTGQATYDIEGKLVWKPVDNISVTAGGYADGFSRHAYYYPFAMFNADNNPLVNQNEYGAYARFLQNFAVKKGSMVQGIFYTVDMSYTQSNTTIGDGRLGDNYFGYGYLGTFKRQFTPQYQYEGHVINGKLQTGYYEKIPTETKVTFTPGGLNPDAENYTNSVFALHGGSFASFTDVQAQGGLVNGQTPPLVYSLWAAPGTITSQYSKNMDQQYTLKADGNATIAEIHHIKMGIEYRQNVHRSFTVGGNFGTGIGDLWTRGRQLLNSHLTQFDTAHPELVYSNGNFTDTINYRYQANEAAQSTFDKNFRNHLISIGARDENGKLIDQQSIINIDAYKPSDLKLSYFSPDELLGNGHSIVNAYGYDYQGNVIRGKQSIADFLDPQKRSEGAYNPIYTAGYIQDRIDIHNLHINAGIRIDRFDANQKVLADPYSMFPIKTAGEVTEINGVAVSHPGSIGSGYYVYVDDISHPTRITGYRNGSTWYTAAGEEETDPKQIAQLSRTGNITPMLENPSQTTISAASFRDYVPQVNIMPRISFSFPISENASFYANYDVLTKRPDNNFGALDYYYYIDTRSTYTLPNPDLKPERRINYELGFKQKLSSTAFFSVNAYYGEIKNLVQLVRYNYAYPVTYTTYGNVDFGTVKGVTVGFDTKRPENRISGMEVSANYTLQFADGTGSGSTSAANLLSAGFPNLRTTFPLNYDTRNQVNCILDYNFGAGNDYTGPVSGKGSEWLSNTNINLTFTAKSGNPYTAQSNVTPEMEIGVENRSSIVGTINGERLPWQFTADLKAGKTFMIPTSADKKKGIMVNAYLQVQNLLDARNIISVYRYTGLANQDGYLQSAAGKSEASRAASQQAFTDQYTVKMNDPANYVSPRFARLGAVISF